jgi:cysteine dioxygenase
MSSSVDIADFVQGLTRIPANLFTPERLHRYFADHPIEPESLASYVFYRDRGYTRNLIFRCELFELMTICWDIGQASTIHNHRDQNCWMAVPSGQLRVQNFRVLEQDRAHMTCRLEPSDCYEITSERPAEVDRDEPVHQVINPADNKVRAVSVHLYSRPFDTCEVYNLERGRFCDMPLTFYSEFGKVVAA